MPLLCPRLTLRAACSFRVLRLSPGLGRHHQGGNPAGGFFGKDGQAVGVGIQGDRDVRMPQAFGDDLGMDPGGPGRAGKAGAPPFVGIRLLAPAPTMAFTAVALRLPERIIWVGERASYVLQETSRAAQGKTTISRKA